MASDKQSGCLLVGRGCAGVVLGIAGIGVLRSATTVGYFAAAILILIGIALLAWSIALKFPWDD
jgi:hypothetical protein